MAIEIINRKDKRLWSANSMVYENIKLDKFLDNLKNLVASKFCMAYLNQLHLQSDIVGTPTSQQNINVGNGFSITNQNIVIGKNVEKVKISGIIKAQVENNQSNYNLAVNVCKNGTAVLNMVEFRGNINMYYYVQCVFSNFILDVKEGDKISLNINASANSNVINNEQYSSYVTVEAI